MNRKKIFWIAITIVLGTPILLVYLTFSNSTGCSQFVIDTYEMHSGIDIPEVDFVNCYYDESLKTRISVYDLNSYIDLSDFELFTYSSQAELLHGIGLLEATECPSNSLIYLASGEHWGTKWTYLIDRKSQRLWAELTYEN